MNDILADIVEQRQAALIAEAASEPVNGCCFKPWISGVVCYTQRLTEQDLLFWNGAGLKIRLWTPDAQEVKSDAEEPA